MLHPSLIERITRSLAYMLRHQPEQFDLELDEFGYADLDDVVAALNERLGEPVEGEDVSQAVEGGDRPRYEIREGRIRALYGHSIQVKPGDPAKPPNLLYVGISKADAERARRYGLRPGRRSFLHLALSPEDALETGRRASRDYAVITVNALDAWEEGINFYDRRSLYLSDPIPTHFLQVGDVQTDGYGDEEGSDRGDRGDRGRPASGGGPQREFRPEPQRRREWRDRPPPRQPERSPERSTDRPPERPSERPAERPSERPDRASEREMERAPQRAAQNISSGPAASGPADRPPDRSFERPAFNRPGRGEPAGERHGHRGREHHARGDSRPPRGDRFGPRQDRDRRPERREPHPGPAPGRETPREVRHAEPEAGPVHPPAPRPSAPASDAFGLGVFESRSEARTERRAAAEPRPQAASAREEAAPPPVEKSRKPPPVESEDSGFGAGI